MLLALFPALAAFVSLYGFVSDPETVADHIAMLGGLLPSAGRDVIETQLRNLISKDDGVDGFGREEDTALNAHTASTFAGHVAVDRGLVFEMLGEMEHHDSLAIVFVRAGALGTGGGGVATIGGRNASTTIHEFGHAFGGLGDEYATQTHDRGGVSNRVNVSDTDDPERVPWAHWIEARVPGIGIVIPALVAPLASAFMAALLDPAQRAVLAYVGGTLGVVIGADLLRLKDLRNTWAPVASIGGAGTFDGIFLAGILAVLLA